MLNTARSRGFRSATFGLVPLLLALACAPNSTSPGAKTSPYAEELSGTAEPAADTETAAEGARDLEGSEAADAGAATSPAVLLRFIVQAKSADAAAELVLGVGGRVTHRLEIIQAVGAELTEEQSAILESHDEVRGIWRDRKVRFEPQQ